MSKTMSPGSKQEPDGEYGLLARFAIILGPSPAFGLDDSRMGLFEGFKQATRNPNAVPVLDCTRAPSGPAAPSAGAPDARGRGAAHLAPA